MFKRRLKSKYKSILIVITLIISLLTISYAYSFSMSKLNIEYNTKIISNNISKDYDINLISKWQIGDRYYYHFTFDTIYKDNIIAKGYTLNMLVPKNTILEAYYGADNGNINNNILSLNNAPWHSNIYPGTNISISFQISTIENNYIPSNISIRYNTENLNNNPYEGYLENEVDNTESSFNFNDGNNTWYLDNNKLIKFNNGLSLSSYITNSNSINLYSSNNYNYDTINFKIYLPNKSNITSININNENIKSYNITNDSRYNIFIYSGPLSLPLNIKINNDYTGYLILDNIYLTNNIIDNKNINLEFNKINSWNSTSQYNIKISNNSNINIIDWKLMIDIDDNIKLENSWIGSTIINNNNIIITPSWNNNIYINNYIEGGLTITCNNICKNNYKKKLIITTSNLDEIEYIYD